MINLFRKLFNCCFIFHKSISKKTYFGLSNIGLIFFILLILFAIVNELNIINSIRKIYNHIYIIFLFCFTLLFLPYNQLILLFTRKDIKNKKINKMKFFSNTNYLFYCSKTSFIFMSVIIFMGNIIFNKNCLYYFMTNINITIMILFILFSIISIFWFSYLIIYKLLDEQLIKTKLNLYVAIASTINLLLQHSSTRELLISLSFIIVSYTWVGYIIEEKLWKRKVFSMTINISLPTADKTTKHTV